MPDEGVLRGPRPRLVLFGDSITQWSFSDAGWGAKLAHWYARKADVINRGLSGYNTVWAALALDKVRAAVPGESLRVLASTRPPQACFVHL